MKLNDLCIHIEQKFKEELKVILHIEGDPLFRSFLSKFLSQFKMSVLEIDQKEKIYEILKYEKVQLIIILSKEIKKGFSEFIFYLKTLVPETKILIILDLVVLEYLYFYKIDFSDLFTWGVDDFIIKPFSLEEFKAKIFKLLKEYLLFKEIKRLEIEDLLTGVFNRKYFEEVIVEESYRALRQKYPLVIFMVHIDNFAWYNQNFGQKEGDKVLKELAKNLKSSTREKIDKVFRYNTEKFALILPHINWQKSLIIVERIIKRWEQSQYKDLTLSIGISQILAEKSLEDSVTSLIKRANEALELAKKEKGNTYEVDKETLRLIPFK